MSRPLYIEHFLAVLELLNERGYPAGRVTGISRLLDGRVSVVVDYNYQLFDDADVEERAKAVKQRITTEDWMYRR